MTARLVDRLLPGDAIGLTDRLGVSEGEGGFVRVVVRDVRVVEFFGLWAVHGTTIRPWLTRGAGLPASRWFHPLRIGMSTDEASQLIEERGSLLLDDDVASLLADAECARMGIGVELCVDRTVDPATKLGETSVRVGAEALEVVRGRVASVRRGTRGPRFFLARGAEFIGALVQTLVETR